MFPMSSRTMSWPRPSPGGRSSASSVQKPYLFSPPRSTTPSPVTRRSLAASAGETSPESSARYSFQEEENFPEMNRSQGSGFSFQNADNPSEDGDNFVTPYAPIPPFVFARHNTTTNLNSTKCSNLNVTTVDFNPGCYAAVVEGRGSARGEVGIATISLSNPTLILSQFTDSRTYVKTATKLSVINPSEILLPNNGLGGAGKSFDGNRSGSERKDKLYEVIAEGFPNVGVVFIHRKYFKDSGGFQMFKNLCSPEYSSVELELRHKHYALAAAFALLRYMEFIHNTVYAPKTLKFEYHAPENSTMIDMETAKHVELLFSSLNIKSKNSLFGIMNSCSTVGGVRLLRSSLFQPSTKLETIISRQEAIEELINKPEILTGIQSILLRSCDIDQLLSLCVTTSKNSENIFVIDRKINNVIGLKHVLELVEPLHTVLMSADSPLLVNARSGLEDSSCAEMLEKIKVVLHDEAKIVKGTAAMRLQRCFAIRKGINGLLDVARQNYCQIVEEVERQVRELGDQHGAALRLGYNAQRGYHVQMMNKPVGKGSLKTPRVKISELPPNFLCPRQSRNSITFTTEEIIQADKKSQVQLQDISVMSNVILSELIIELRSTIGTLYKLSEVFSLLDVLVSMADISSGPGFVRPSFNPDEMKIVQGRHPILDHINSAGINRKAVIANNAHVNGENNLIVLTGCNMSGKSTYLRQIVLHQVMAQMGCYVPAEEATFRICDSIFSRVSTADNLECNASTFMVEMKEASFILNNLGSTSLVIIDELGRGTAVDEGAALCWAIAEKLIKTTAFTFLATHFVLMPLLGQLYPSVNTHHFITERKANDGVETIIHTHKLEARDDSDGSSEVGGTVKNYGLELARISALPPSIVRDAFEIAKQLKSNDVPKVLVDTPENQNYRQLFHRLKVAASKGMLCNEDLKDQIVNYCKELQRLCKE